MNVANCTLSLTDFYNVLLSLAVEKSARYDRILIRIILEVEEAAVVDEWKIFIYWAVSIFVEKSFTFADDDFFRFRHYQICQA